MYFTESTEKSPSSIEERGISGDAGVARTPTYASSSQLGGFFSAESFNVIHIKIDKERQQIAPLVD
ncbi:MAG: hypothetical protein A2Z14_04130 [Chloroflexi bacterium RBG_16_48_8]|nr:MAG: hypothetical protein A2Z14_04130 [Chloroflexi bacterium RBG_16_48_8]